MSIPVAPGPAAAQAAGPWQRPRSRALHSTHPSPVPSQLLREPAGVGRTGRLFLIQAFCGLLCHPLPIPCSQGISAAVCGSTRRPSPASCGGLWCKPCRAEPGRGCSPVPVTHWSWLRASRAAVRVQRRPAHIGAAHSMVGCSMVPTGVSSGESQAPGQCPWGHGGQGGGQRGGIGSPWECRKVA